MLHPNSITIHAMSYTCHGIFHMCQVMPNCMWTHLSDLYWFLHNVLGIKKATQREAQRMKMRISAQVKTPVFFHKTFEYYTKTAIKAAIRHINHSKPFNYKKAKAMGKNVFVPLHFSVGLHIIHNSLRHPIKAFNSTSNRHTCKKPIK